MTADYVELHCHSAFSLLDGASSPEALVERARALAMPALALTDHEDLGGIVRFAQAAREAGIEGIVGAELTVLAGEARTHLTLLAESREGYGNLATLITRARMEAPRGRPGVPLDLLAAHARGLVALTGCPRGWVPSLVRHGDDEGARDALITLLDIFERRVAVECWDHGLEQERAMVGPLIALARALGVPWVVTNDVHYATPRSRIVHDVLCALRHERTLDAMGTRLRPSGEWYLKGGAQMAARWRHAPEGLRATRAIAERCVFRLGDLQPSLPTFPLPPGVTADEYLERLVMQGAWERWGVGDDDLPERNRAQLAHELSIIRKLGLAGYFLIVWDIVRFARREGILCQGRGSAANSAVCFCLGITAIDPIRMNLLFERFLSEERQEAPDIDLDFAHRERERVIQYVYERYGREHAAMVCEQISYRGRSAVRDAARVLGFSVEQASTLALLSDRFSARATAEAMRAAGEDARGEADRVGSAMVRGTEATTRLREERAAARRPDAGARGAPPDIEDRTSGVAAHHPADAPAIERRRTLLERAGLDRDDRRVRVLPAIVAGMHDIPRHRSIHVGGFVLTEEPLSTIVPVEPAAMPGRTVVQWDKDDVEGAGLVKIDLLGLGMLTLIQECLRHIRLTRGHVIDLARLDMADQAVYDDLCRADTIGLFQVESRAQMNTLPRLKPRRFYDLVVEVALIRPGPIQGEMVHPYLRRRAGEEEVTYPHPSVEPILKRTLGVPLFQEQGMQVAIACAGFTPGEADQLRRAMGHKRSRERMAAICERLIEGMERNGIPEDTARRIYNQINAFADYGFPESHAASFALLVYASAYLKHYYAPEYTAALLNAQPMGFYAPGTIIEDARRHGVRVLPIDVTRSGWDCTLEGGAGDQGSGTAPHSLLPPSGAPPRLLRSPPPTRSTPSNHRAPHPSLTPDPRPSAPVAPAVRLGLRLVRGLGDRARERLERALAAAGPFRSIGDVVARSGLDRRALRALAEAGALDAFVPDEPSARRRRTAIWRLLEAERGDAGPLAPAPIRLEVPAQVPAMTPVELTAADYRLTGISLLGHPMRHLRALLAPNGVRTAREVLAMRDGTRDVAAAGLVICRQRPGTAHGFVFLTLEDETGLLNVVVTPRRFERQALLISTARLLLVRGALQVEEGVVNLRGELFRELRAPVGAEGARGHDFH
ncbi:MAG TPA: DNA polymerase III subunit alpha [Gemmatimonadaceae bacterium]|nr:DNA polymerase III subunit alpha [Gemmatimonadaceae bacterium]